MSMTARFLLLLKACRHASTTVGRPARPVNSGDCLLEPIAEQRYALEEWRAGSKTHAYIGWLLLQDQPGRIDGPGLLAARNCRFAGRQRQVFVVQRPRAEPPGQPSVSIAPTSTPGLTRSAPASCRSQQVLSGERNPHRKRTEERNKCDDGRSGPA